MKPALKHPTYVYKACSCNEVGTVCVVQNRAVSVDEILYCKNLSFEERKELCHNSQSDVQRYNDFMSHGHKYEWFEYWDNIHSDVFECKQATKYQHKKDKKVIDYLSTQKLSNGFDKLEIVCVGHYPKQFDSVGNSPVLKKVNLNDLDVGEYQNNRWAESRAFVAKDLFSVDAEWVGYVGASWNDKFIARRIEDFTEWAYAKHLVNSKELVFCANVNCVCNWAGIIKGIIKDHDDIFKKIQDEFDLEIKHVKVPFCNNFITHRSIVEEYLNYLDSEQIMPRISSFVQREVQRDFVGDFFKHRVEAYLMEMINCFWWAKKDYMYIANAKRKPDWYKEENNNNRLKAYEDSLLDKNK